MSKATVTLLVSAAIVASVAARADQGPQDKRFSYDKYVTERNKQNFRGWKGILFYCSNNEPSNQAISRICENTTTNAEFLAAAAKLDLVKAGSSFDLGYRGKVDHRLILSVDVAGTRGDKTPSAIHAIVRAYAGYSRAIQDAPASGKKNPRTLPRAGDLVLWEKYAIGASAGAPEDLVQGVSEAIETLLKQFFTEYLKARE